MSKVLLVVILMMGGIGYWYYNDSQEKMAVLYQNNATLKANETTLKNEIADQEAALYRAEEEFKKKLDKMEENAKNLVNKIQELQQNFEAIRKQNDRLAAKLEQIDLEAAAIANAAGIERAVNRGTKNAGRCFEILSGSPLTEEELNAENEIAFNKECPWLWPGNDPERVSRQ